MIENLRSAFQGIWSHKLRSVLTMLGVIIGIASIIAIVSTIKGTNEQIMQNLIGAGNNNVTISLRQGEGEYWMDSGAPEGVGLVTPEIEEEIRAIEEVADASFFHSRTWIDNVVRGKNTLGNGKALGVDSHYLSTTGYIVYAGRGFVEDDFAKNRKVVLLDEAAVSALFPEGGGVGGTIDIRSEPFTVIGLIRRADNFQPVINSFQDYQTYHQEEYGMILLTDACWPIIYNYDEPKNCVVRASSVDTMSAAGKKAAEVMNKLVATSGQSGEGEESIAYRADDLVERARNKQQLASSNNRLLIWVASIALLVGGIGVMNIMLVSVTERTNEIGLKKALGAKKRRIRAQFLTESAMLTSLGGVLGVIAGIILARVISKISETPVAISVPAIILGVAFSMVIGIVFGILPATKASNLDPIEALNKPL